VIVDGTRGFKKAIYLEGLPSTDMTHQVGVKFSFNRAIDPLSAAADFMSVELTEVASGGGRIALSLQRQPGANSGKYKLSFFENSGSSNSSGSAGFSDETVWGFADAADVTSDDLWLQMTVSRGADASSWMVSGVLTNLSTGVSVEMGTGVVGAFDTSAAYFTDDLYGLMSSGKLDSDSNISNRVVDVFALGEPVLLPEAVSIDTHFTLAEDYAAGDLAADSAWDGNSSFTVDPTNTGTVTLPSGAVGFRKVIHQVPLTSNEVYSTGIEFSFDRTNDTVSASQPNLISVEFSEDATASGNRLGLQLRRQASPNADKYLLSMVDQSGTSSFPNSGSFTEDALGFDINEASSASDSLWLEFTIQRGATSAEWVATGVIKNLTTGVEVMTFDAPFDTTEAFFNDNYLYGWIGSVAAENNTKTLNRMVDRFVATGEAAPVVPEQVADVEFTAEQGYEAGQLYNQIGYWSSSNQPDTVVDATVNHVVLPAATNWKQSTYTLPLSAGPDVLEIGGVFRFNRTISADVTSDKKLINFNLVTEFSDNPKGMRISLQRMKTNAALYEFGFVENIGEFSFLKVTDIPESELGLDGNVTNDQSDDLEFVMKVYPGATTSDWSATVTLRNLTLGADIMTVFVPKGQLIVDEAWSSASSFYGGFNSSDLEADSFTSSRQIESFYVAVGGFSSAYEQWAVANGVGGIYLDSDADGLDNLGEYALGGNPNDPADQGIASTYQVIGETFSFVHVTLADVGSGVSYIVETTVDLMTAWTSDGVISVTGAHADPDFDSVTSSISMDGEHKGFIRLRVIED
jgi:hypothetical protein